MTPTALVPLSKRPRQADPRAGLHTLVTRATRLIAEGESGAEVVGQLCAQLATLVHADRVRLVESDGIRLGRPILSADYAAYATPWQPAGRLGALEAAFAAGARPDAWACQLIESAASLAALILAAERGVQVSGPTLRADRTELGPLIGSSEVMRVLRERVERVASTDFTILIEGESGVGKELVARQIHACSRRRHGPFVAINCAALVETLLEAELFGIEERTATGVRGRRGKFEHADGGTLFLDEVSDLSLSAQAKLLRAIQDLTVERVGGSGGRRVNVRIVAATNRSLSGLVANGVFRADVFYRLSGVEVHVPPLRFRKSDIVELAQYFLARHQGRGRLTMTPAAVDALLAYDWPGNVRELERMIEGAVAIAESRQVRLDDLPASLRGDYAHVLMPAAQDDDTMRAWGSRYARLVLDRCQGNKREACRKLCISYHTLNAYLAYQPGQRRLTRRVRAARLPAPVAEEQHA